MDTTHWIRLKSDCVCVYDLIHGAAENLMKSSLRRSLLSARASRTSSRICLRSWLSSVKDFGSGSRPLSVRNFNRTVGARTENKQTTPVRKLETSCKSYISNLSFALLPFIVSHFRDVHGDLSSLWLHHRPDHPIRPTFPHIKPEPEALNHLNTSLRKY